MADGPSPCLWAAAQALATGDAVPALLIVRRGRPQKLGNVLDAGLEQCARSIENLAAGLSRLRPKEGGAGHYIRARQFGLAAVHPEAPGPCGLVAVEQEKAASATPSPAGLPAGRRAPSVRHRVDGRHADPVEVEHVDEVGPLDLDRLGDGRLARASGPVRMTRRMADQGLWMAASRRAAPELRGRAQGVSRREG